MKEKILKIEQIIKEIPTNLKNFFIYLKEEKKVLIKKLKDLTLTNYNLGLYHLSKGNIKDAKMRFFLVTKFKPELADAHYQLARCYINDLAFEKAREQLKIAMELDSNLKLKSNYRTEIINQNLSKLYIPSEITKEDYNMLAQEYDNFMLSQNNYMAHIELAKKIKEYLKSSQNILDLGCGTGLVGEALAYENEKLNITGIDISENMLLEAKKLYLKDKPLYQKLETQDLNDFKNNNKFDIILSCLSLNYLNDLGSFVKKITNNLLPEGILAFVILKAASNDVEFNYNYACFAYNETYLKALLNEEELELLSLDNINLFNNKTPGLLVLLKKK